MSIPTIGSYEYLLNKIELQILKPKTGKVLKQPHYKTYLQRLQDFEDHITTNKAHLSRSEEADIIKLYQYSEILFATSISSMRNKYAHKAFISNRLGNTKF